MKKTLIWFLCVFAAVYAAAAEDDKQAPELALVYPVSPAASPLVIDGDLSDAAWKEALWVSSFTDSGSPNLAVQQTAMALLYDKDALYLAIRCFETDMDKLVTPSSGLDAPFWNDDSIEFFIDRTHSHVWHYQLAVTAALAKYDSKEGDALWTRQWQAEVRKYPDQWTVEIALPFGIFDDAPSAKAGDFWGFNLCRERHAGGKLELFNWADVKRVFNRTHLFGHLAFMPSGWESNPAALAVAAQGGGRTETQLQARDGYWSFTPGNPTPRKSTFGEACRKRFAQVPAQALELEKIFQETPGLKEEAEYRKLRTVYAQWYEKSATEMSAVDFAQANVFYAAFVDAVNAFYWKAKLEQLDKSF